MLSMPISSSKYIKGDKQVGLIWQTEKDEEWKKSPLHKVVIWNIKLTKAIHEFGFLKHKETHSLDFISKLKYEGSSTQHL